MKKAKLQLQFYHNVFKNLWQKVNPLQKKKKKKRLVQIQMVSRTHINFQSNGEMSLIGQKTL